MAIAIAFSFDKSFSVPFLYISNSVELFNKVGWLPIDDVIRIRKLALMHKIVNGCCPQYFKHYISYVTAVINHTRPSAEKRLDKT